MSLQPLQSRYEPYADVAVGWGALRSTAHFWLDGKQPLRNLRALFKTNQNGGFDCLGCAWSNSLEDGQVKFCENGVKTVNWEATRCRVDVAFFACYSVNALREQGDYWLEYQGHLIGSMRYDPLSDHYQSITWDVTLALVAEYLHRLDSLDQAEFYTSGRASNEAAYLYQLPVRAFDTNDFPDYSDMCHEASGVALGRNVGAGKGSVTFDDSEHVDAIFILGQNPGTNHPCMLKPLHEVVKRGARVVCFNPLKERGLERFQHPQSVLEVLISRSPPLNAASFHPVLGGDMAAIRGVVKLFLAWERSTQAKGGEPISDHASTAEYTDGLEAYLTGLDVTPWEHLGCQSGLSLAKVKQAVQMYRRVNRVIVRWAMGITQYHHSMVIIQGIISLQFLRSNLGRPGTGLCSVHGHSNVQGDHTMGINERSPAALLDALGWRFGFEVSCHNGHNTVEAIIAMLADKSKVFIGLGGNSAQAIPDSPRTHVTPAPYDPTVYISTKFDRSHLTTGRNALTLPHLERTDIDRQARGPQAVTVESLFSVTHVPYEQSEPLSQQMRSKPTVIVGTARATLDGHPTDWDALVANYERIHELITNVIPGPVDLDRRVWHSGGLYLSNTAGKRRWNIANGETNFVASPPSCDPLPAQIRDSDLEPDLILQTLHFHDQCNTATYDLGDCYRGVKGQREVVFANGAGIRYPGYQPGDEVDLISLWSDDIERQVYRFTLLAFDIPAGRVAAHCPETNPLVPLENANVGSHTPTSKFIAVRLEKATGDGRVIWSPRKTPSLATGGDILRGKPMKGLEGRPPVGARMTNIPPAKIPISTLKSRFAFGLRPPPPKKVPHKK